MPKLNEWGATLKEIKVVAVSLDTDKTLHQETIKQLSLTYPPVARII
jgi:hypothetical protein